MSAITFDYNENTIQELNIDELDFVGAGLVASGTAFYVGVAIGGALGVGLAIGVVVLAVVAIKAVT